MAIYAVVENGAVINTIEWDGVAQWSPPTGATAVQVPDGADVGIGSAYANGVFTPPPAPPAMGS